MNNPDKHGNEWEDQGVYLCEIAFNRNNCIHLTLVEASVTCRDGWRGAHVREGYIEEGETEVRLMQPTYDQHFNPDEGWHSKRRDPNSLYYLRIVKKMDWTFRDPGPDADATKDRLGKPPWDVL